MEFPIMNEVNQYRDMTSVFGGYNRQLSCAEGQFYDMKNMTSQYFPVMSPRPHRGIVRDFVNPQAVLDKEELMWIDNGILYSNGKKVDLGEIALQSKGKKTMAKMGAYVVIMPDKVWYNAETGDYGYMERGAHLLNIGVDFTLVDKNGVMLETYDEDYYKDNAPKNGDYMISNANGKTTLKIYSAGTSTWTGVGTTYVMISGHNIGAGFEKGDGVKITIDNSRADWGDAKNIFVNDEGDGKLSTNAIIHDRTDDSIIITGIISGNIGFFNMPISVERKVPDMSFITECNNRLWGCSENGHEIYCCKLGDVTNWNCFQGLSTDSWSATIGSDGKFTGAVTYLGYPIFFKEDCLIKVSVSGTGAHQTKETRCRGVQKGSERSLTVLNETLYYKSSNGVCAYTGSLPIGISDDLGEVRYHDAVSGTIGERCYISMKDDNNVSHMFVFDQKNGIWCKEDNTDAMYFCKYGDDLYYIDVNDNKLKSVRGTSVFEGTKREESFDWFVESGNIGYESPDNKYISRINLRIALDFGTNVDFYMQYDSQGEWEHKFNMSGKGTKTFTIPIIPKRCDHFKYKIAGRGGCKIYSITKTTEQGSDI